MARHATRKSVPLTTVAANMRKDVGGAVNWTCRKLGGGLEMTLLRMEDKSYRLAVEREVKEPSDTELKVLLNAFKLPPATQWTRREVDRRKNMEDGVTVRVYLNVLHMAECSWGGE